LRRRLVLFDLPPLHLLDGGAIAQADATRFRADLDYFEVVFLAGLERSGTLQGSGGGAMHGRTFVAPAFIFDFGVVAKRFDVLAEFHESAERGDARNFAFNELSDLVSLEPIAPDVVDLLDAEGDAAILRVDLQHLGGDRLALAEDFVRIHHPPGPTDIADVHEAVEAILDLDEGPKLRDVAHLSGNHRAHRIFFRDLQPRIRQGLLHPQGDAAVAGLDVQHDDINFFADLRDLGGMGDLLVPAHFRDVHQAFDALLELHENTVVHDADDFAPDLAACRIFFGGVHPRIGLQLLQSERDALLFLVELED